jgi:NAD(P)-dependent dehydrogenase (short-subunit alcohol dehydrogenase family)
VSLVTGAARGIGLGIAQALARRGDRIVLADVLFADQTVCSNVSGKLGKDALLLNVDITRAEAVAGLVGETLDRFGRIDCLVNAAAVSFPAPIHETSEADWDKTMAVNLKGAFLLSKSVAAPMIEQRFGRIIHIASTAAHTAAACLAAYAASKHGLVGLVRGMACDLASYGITVNAVCPGNTETEMLVDVLRQRAEHQGRTLDEVVGDIVRKTPIGRIGQPGDVAAAVLFLSSDEAEFITGQALTVDGGRSLNLV